MSTPGPPNDPVCRTGEVLDHRFRLDQPLGEGPLHHVFRATDLLELRSVCVKIPRRFFRGNSGFGVRYRKDVLDLLMHQHPGWSTPLMLAEHDGLPFQVLDLVEGQPLNEWYESIGRNEQRLLGLLKSALKNLQHLHRTLGRIHGGLKPSNILVTPKGDPIFLDLAVTGRLEDHLSFRHPNDKRHELYFSPEQIVGERAGPSADIYSLGLVLYRILALRHPFIELEATELVDCARPERLLGGLLEQLQHQPDPASSFREDVPLWADRFLARCLQPHPKERFSDPGEALDWLRNHGRSALEMESKLSQRGNEPVPIGREAELLPLEERLQRLAGGDQSASAMIRFRGAPGIGKSRCLDWLEARAKGQGIRVLELGRGAEGGLDLESMTVALCGSAYEAHHSRPTIELLVDASMEKPILLVIDPLQQADEIGAAFLQELAWVVGDLPLLVLAVDDETAFRCSAVQAFAAGLTPETRLGPLDRRGIAHLIEERVWLPPSLEVANWVTSVSGGNPLTARLLLEWLQKQRLLRESFELEWERTPPQARPTLDQLIEAKLQGLSTTTRNLLEMGAILGPVFNLNTLRAITYRDSDEIDASLGEAVAAELLELGSRSGALTYRWSHNLFQAALTQGLQARRKQRIHRLAAAFYSRGEPQPTRLAYHFLEAGDRTEVFYWGSRAILKANRAGRRGETSSWLNELLKQTRDEEWLGPDLAVARREVARDQVDALDLPHLVGWLSAQSGRHDLEPHESLSPHERLIWQVQKHLASPYTTSAWQAVAKELVFSLNMAKMTPGLEPALIQRAVVLLRREWGFRTQRGEPFPQESD